MSQIKECPILFSAPMVRAILEGRKTVTRRAVKVQPSSKADIGSYGLGQPFIRNPDVTKPNPECLHGRPGDRLWVRETFIDLRGTGVEHRPDRDGPLQRYAYAADCRPGSHSDEARKDFGLKYKPSIHMPRAACHILLEIPEVRVERLQDIQEEQALAEGIVGVPFRPDDGWPIYTGYMVGPDDGKTGLQTTAVKAFAGLWDSVGGDWKANPWVWVVEFKRVTP